MKPLRATMGCPVSAEFMKDGRVMLYDSGSRHVVLTTAEALRFVAWLQGELRQRAVIGEYKGKK